ncbi:MAG TPA: PQQ-dependent dehydrogenase, methanol/ethanol family [Burkholderiales bacterium]|nr:PQQ-dependent dehydrogenase, methanol/ethanol family [Burkholderiales bacterium]
MKLRIATALASCALAAAASAQSTADLNADGRNSDNVLTYGMGYHQNRYSPLKQVNRQTVKRLVPAWNVSLNSNYGEQGQPLVNDGLLFASDAEATVAIDIATGRQAWRVPVDFDPATPRVVCCGVSNKGLAVYNGKVYRGTLDAYLVALDQKTGKQVWKEKVAEWKEGFSITGAPLAVNGVVITGISGAEFGVRGFLDAYDPETGKRLWRLYTIPAPGEKGSETWPKDDSWQRGGGSTWITGSYDPELDLVYWGIGNAGPWNPGGRPGDNLYTASVLAIKPKTGEVVWHYQLVPNEMFDLDANWEWILAELPVDGAKRKVMMHFSRGGFLYVLDRTSGKLLSAKPFERVNWATHVDMATGRPVESEVAKRARAGEQIELWPGQWGGKNWAHAAFNPETGLLYANTMHNSRLIKFVPIEYKVGQRYVGLENLPAPREPGSPIAHVDAIEPLTAKHKWRTPIMDIPHYSAMLATAGGLLFTGKETGEFIAIDIDTGKTVWQFQTGSGINAQPVTFTHQGRQYVAIQSGIGGVNVLRMGDALKNVPRGGSVWAFALMPD